MEQNSSVQTTAPKGMEKIKIGEKLSYAIAGIGNIPIMTIIGSFLLIFYTDVVMLDPIAVGFLFLIARVLDAFTDLFVGFVIDHLPRLKMGRFRPYLIIGSLICAINFVVLWLGPGYTSSGSSLIIAYIAYILIGITFPCMDIPLNSLLPTMTRSPKERGTLAMIRGIGSMAGGMIFSIIAVPIVSSFSTQLQGYTVLTIIIAIIVFGFSTLGALGVRERVNPIKAERYSLKTMFKIVFNSKPLIIIYLAGVCMSIGAFIKQGAMMYYATYNLQNPALMGILAMTMIIGSLIGMPIATALMRKIDKKTVMIVSNLVLGIGSLVLIFIPHTNVVLVVVSMILANVGMGGVSMLGPVFQAECIDFVEHKHGYRAEGIVASFNSFVTKMGQAAGGALPAFVLSLTGYVANAAQQSSATIFGINACLSVVPFVFSVIGAVLYIAYPITQAKYKQITEELDERRHTE